MIVLDLEWNSGRKNSGFDEILQIGAVRIPALGAPIVDTFNIYVTAGASNAAHRSRRSVNFQSLFVRTDEGRY